jgi:hypothetical protein
MAGFDLTTEDANIVPTTKKTTNIHIASERWFGTYSG